MANDINSALFLGQAYFDDDNYENAVPYLKIAAEGGKADAQCMLGFCYRDGLGVPVNKREATRLFEQASIQGQPIAQCMLADAYHHGCGTEKNIDQAMRWYRESADNGVLEAQFMFAKLCTFLGWNQDAEIYAKMAFDNGYPAAVQLMSEIYDIKEVQDFNDECGLKLAFSEISKLMGKKK